MELKKHINFRKFAAVLYFLAFFVYLIIGLAPADAVQYEIEGSLEMPAIGLQSDVTRLKLHNHKLDTPDTIVGSFSWEENKTLLIGHSTTVFENLNLTVVGDVIVYNGKNYWVTDIVVKEKSKIIMEELLEGADKDTLVIMTCAGEIFESGDATHRLIVTAVSD